MKSVKRISLFLIIISIFASLFMKFNQYRDVVVQNRIIDDVFKLDSYDGYIFIPRFGIKRLIKHGTDGVVLDSLYVGIHEFSGELDSSDLIILAGHNIDNVFSKLHDILIGDVVFIRSGYFDRRFVVYDKRVVDEYDFSFFNNRSNELMLITCTNNEGYRLLVFLREDL